MYIPILSFPGFSQCLSHTVWEEPGMRLAIPACTNSNSFTEVSSCECYEVKMKEKGLQQCNPLWWIVQLCGVRESNLGLLAWLASALIHLVFAHYVPASRGVSKAGSICAVHIEDCEGLLLSCCSSVIEHWQLKPGFPDTAGFPLSFTLAS